MKDYSEYSDEELFKELHNGNREVTEVLLDKYKPLVKSKCHALYLAGADREDLIQEGMIGLFKAVRDYAPQKQVPFAAFAKTCVERQLYTAIEAASRQKHVPLNSYVSLSDEMDGLLAAGIEEEVIARESFHEQLEIFRERLSPLENEVLRLYMEGKSYQEIADMLDKPAKSIDNAIQRMKVKFRELKKNQKPY